ncbi:hypothetical protein BH09GEM1_BH09GEM1_05310 [soil metagenome]
MSLPPTRLLLLALVAACQQNAPAEHYGFIARLGRDTVSLENVTRRGNTIVSDEVDRFPRVRRRHTRIVLTPDGSIQHLEMDIHTPSEPSGERDRHVEADVDHDYVRITKKDSTGVRNITLHRDGKTLVEAHLEQMYSLTDLYFAAALARADSLRLAAGDSVPVNQFYIDREFDRFPLGSGIVRPLPGGKAELRHDWLSGRADATFDSTRHMLTYSGARSTYKVEVRRITDALDIEAIGARFAALETANGLRQLSVRDTTRATIGRAIFLVDYGRPLARGRVLLGDVLPFDRVWRTGANAATQFTTSARIVVGNMPLPPGTYTLWTVPHAGGKADLIVNRQTGQWGTGYDPRFDLGTQRLATEVLKTPAEKFTISIVPTSGKLGTMVMEWGTFRWTVPVEVL